MYETFTQDLAGKVKDIACDLSKYREILHPETGIKKIALFPRVLTEEQKKALELQKEQDRLREEEEARRKEEEEATQSALTKGGKTPGKGTPAPKAAPAKAAGKPMSSHSSRSRPRTGTSQAELSAMERAR
jgi:hypothetical protein